MSEPCIFGPAVSTVSEVLTVGFGLDFIRPSVLAHRVEWLMRLRDCCFVAGTMLMC